MKKQFLLMLILFTLVSQVSCSSFYQEGDYFFISREGARMPVWVRGNIDSGTFIIACHGGPGGTTQYLGKFYSFRKLEELYTVVYWDQRNSGNSQGNPAPESISPEQMAVDLEMVVDAVTQKYNPGHLFLYGVSWGGTLAFQFAADLDRQQLVDGLIIEGGGHDMPLLLSTSVARVLQYAESQIADGTDADMWLEAKEWLTANPYSPEDWGLEGYRRFAGYLEQANRGRDYGTARIDGDFTGPGPEDIFFSPLSFAMFFSPATLLPNLNILDLDLSDKLADIAIPVLLLWGEHDINSPSPDMPQDAASVLPNETFSGPVPLAGHNPSIDNPVEYLLRFTGFIDTITGAK